MSEPQKIMVAGDALLAEVVHTDVMVVGIPEDAYAFTDDGRVLSVPFVQGLLRRVIASAGRQAGMRLHHGEFRITGDPEQVREFAVYHGEGCPCLAAVDATVRVLEANPGVDIAWGEVHWCAPVQEARVDYL